MVTITRDAVIAAVRKNLDEQGLNPSAMYGQSQDSQELDSIIYNTLPEALEYIHLVAPIDMVDGEELNESSTALAFSVTNKVLDINFTGSKAVKVARLLSFKCGSSDLLTEAYFEDSAIGRKQKNKYVQGKPDEPVLVLMGDSEGLYPHYKYYTTEDGVSEANVSFSLRYYAKPEADAEGSYKCSSKLENQVIYYLTGLVLSIFNEKEKATHFFALAKGE